MTGDEEIVKSILDNPAIVIIVSFEKDGKFYVHPIATSMQYGLHGGTLRYEDVGSAMAATAGLMSEIDSPWFIIGNIIPKRDVFKFVQLKSKDGSGNKDSSWEQSEGEMPLEEFKTIFESAEGGAALHEDICAMLVDKHPPNATDSDVAELMAGDDKPEHIIKGTPLSGIN